METKHKIIDLEKDVFQISDKVRFIGIMDEEGKVLSTRTSTDKKIIDEEEAMFEVDLHIISNIQAVLDEPLGKVRSIRILREKVSQGVFYLNKKTIFISCEPDMTIEEFVKIENYMNSIKKY